MKSLVLKDLESSKHPLVTWDNCVERQAHITNIISINFFKLQGANPHKDIAVEQ